MQTDLQFKSKPAMFGQARIMALCVAGFAAFVVAVALLLWPSRLGLPSIIVALQGRFTNETGKVLYKVAITNNAHNPIEFLVTRYQAFKFITSGWTTNMMSATNFVLKPDMGNDAVVDAPWAATNAYIAVLYRRERGRREMHLRSIGFRLGVCKMYANWEELKRYELNTN